MVINGWERALRYAGCAASIAFAATTQAWVVAAIGCAVLFAAAVDR